MSQLSVCAVAKGRWSQRLPQQDSRLRTGDVCGSGLGVKGSEGAEQNRTVCGIWGRFTVRVGGRTQIHWGGDDDPKLGEMLM